MVPWLIPVIGIGIGLVAWGEVKWKLPQTLSIVFADLGAALVGGTFFAILVDFVLAQHLAVEAQRLNEDVSDRVDKAIKTIEEREADHLIKSRIPPIVFDLIDTHVIKTPFSRSGLSWTVILLPGPEGSVKVNITTAFTVINNTDHPQNYPIRQESTFEPDVARSHPGACKFTRLSVQREGEPKKEWSGRELQKLLKTEGDKLSLSYDLALKPKGRADLVTQDEDIQRGDDFVDLVTTDIANGCELQIVYQQLESTHEVNVFVLHPEENRFRATVMSDGVQLWRLESGMLPFQGTSVSWRLRRATESTSVEDS